MSTSGNIQYIGGIYSADQNTSGALLESPMRTAMHGKSRVSSVISVELN